MHEFGPRRLSLWIIACVNCKRRRSALLALCKSVVLTVLEDAGRLDENLATEEVNCNTALFRVRFCIVTLK